MNKDDMTVDTSNSVMTVICDKTVNHDVSAELTLPDYQPDIRKLLSVSEKIFTPARYVSGSLVECNGIVEFKILYLGTDGGLYSLSESAEYELNVPVEAGSDIALSEGVCTLVNTCRENLTARVSQPRRVSIRMRMRSHVRSYAKRHIGDGFSELDRDSSVQRLFAETENANLSCISSDIIELEDEIGGIGDDMRVIGADAEVFVTDIRPAEDVINLGGEVQLRLLAGREGRRAEVIRRKLRLDASIENEGIDALPLCRASGKVTDISVTVEDGKILCSLSVIIDALVCGNKIWRYTADLYSTERESSCRTISLALPMAIACGNGNFSQNERISISDANIPEGAEVVDAWGSIVFDSCRTEDGRYIFGGQSRYTLLCERDGEYSVSEISLPVKYEIEGEECDAFTYDAVAFPVNCRARVDGDVLCLDSEVAVSVDVFGEANASAVSEVSLGNELESPKGRITVYYPCGGETSWDVAKKYHVPRSELSTEKSYYLF